MGRAEADKDKSPERRCVVSGQSGPKSGLIRFVIGPEDQVVPDLLEKLPGRGIWVSADRAALETAVSKGHFSRSARREVKVPDGMVADLEARLSHRVTDLLSMARKAGRAVAGFEKVKGWLLSGEARLLLQASDGSERGKTRLRPPPGEGTFIGVLTASELGLAFGREHVIHAALAAGGLTDRVRDDALRLSGVRGTALGKAT
jgi:predicted RNA-binding protein YlxR (DUF448 family)